MSGLWLYGAIACMAVATIAFLHLVRRQWRLRARGEERAQLPPVLGLLQPVALLLEPCADVLMTRGRRDAHARRLEALGFASALTPGRWEATCIAAALAGAAAVAALPGTGGALAAVGATAAYLCAARWLQGRWRAQQSAIARELPAWLDLMTVCVEAGSTLTAGLRMLVERAPPGPLCSYFERVLREVRGGRPRAESFSHVARIYDAECLTTLASALEHAEGSGMSLGQVLRNQGEQRTAERFAHAEKLAMQAPVKMLAPLILCIFPCTFIVIGVPIAVRLKEALGA